MGHRLWSFLPLHDVVLLLKIWSITRKVKVDEEPDFESSERCKLISDELRFPVLREDSFRGKRPVNAPIDEIVSE